MKVKEFLKNSMEYLNFDKEVIENKMKQNFYQDLKKLD